VEAQTAQQAYDGIVAHINKQIQGGGGKYSDWYCGVASNWEERLFKGHNVPQGEYWRTVRRCYTHTDARSVEANLLQLGCDGGKGGGDETTVYVYAYLKGTMTNP